MALPRPPHQGGQGVRRQICPKLQVKHVPDLLNGRDPTFNRLIASINTEQHNHKRSVFECVAIDAGYKIKF